MELLVGQELLLYSKHLVSFQNNLASLASHLISIIIRHSKYLTSLNAHSYVTQIMLL